jgi:crossover junction endodeoxyribonuclease RuvC
MQMSLQKTQVSLLSDCFSDWLLFTFRASEVKTQHKGTGMRVLGIDPGLRNMGWGVIDVAGSRISHVANGICHSSGDDLASRLLTLYDQMTDVVARWQPETAAVEQTFVNKDAVGTLKLGQARAIALLVPAQTGITVAEYAPNKVKKTVVGVGHADKGQIDHMVRLQLPGVNIAGPDSADALAIALCHAHYARSADRLGKALQKAAL